MTETNASEGERVKMHEQNRRSWNAVTPAHNSHKRDQAGFLRAGGSTLFPEELELLGPLDGRRLVHLQCNCGQDSVSLALQGAAVTGVDISDRAIEFARALARATEVSASFERADLFDWFDSFGARERFELAFSSYGSIGWLADLERWARGVAKVLAPGGRLVLLEFHPLVWSLGPGGALTGDPYFIEAPLEEAGGVNDYVREGLAPSGFEVGSEDFTNPEPAYSFQWTVGEIVGALIGAGLRIERLREYPYANGCVLFEGMRALPGRRYAMPEGKPALPLMLGVVARREG